MFWAAIGQSLDYLVQILFPMESWTKGSFKVPSSLGYSIILQYDDTTTVPTVFATLWD